MEPPSVTVLALDHIVVAAATLAQGEAWCETTFGFVPTAGGKHPLFGTHNRASGLTVRPSRGPISKSSRSTPAPPHRAGRGGSGSTLRSSRSGCGATGRN